MVFPKAKQNICVLKLIISVVSNSYLSLGWKIPKNWGIKFAISTSIEYFIDFCNFKAKFSHRCIKGKILVHV